MHPAEQSERDERVERIVLVPREDASRGPACLGIAGEPLEQRGVEA